MKRRFCYLVCILHRIVVCRTSLFFFLLSSSFSSFLFHVILRSSTTSFIHVGLLFVELLFDFYVIRRYSVVIFPSMAAGSLGAIRAWGPSQGLNSGIRASVTLSKLSYFVLKTFPKAGTPDGSPSPCGDRVFCTSTAVRFPIVAVMVRCLPFSFSLGIFLR